MITQAEPSEFRALIVEDNKAFRDYLRSALRELPNITVVGEAHDGLEAVERAVALQPDLIFLDIGLPGLNGIEAAYHIRRDSPGGKIIFLTQESSAELVHEALSLGAAAYILKSRCHSDLHTAIETVLLGKKFVSEGLDGHGR